MATWYPGRNGTPIWLDPSIYTVLQDYLTNRKVTLNYGSEKFTKEVQGGVPQGSVTGKGHTKSKTHHPYGRRSSPACHGEKTERTEEKTGPSLHQQTNVTVTEEEVRDALLQAKLKRAPGPDGLTVEFLRKFWPVLGKTVTLLFNECLSKAYFPGYGKEEDWLLYRKEQAET